MHGFNLILEAVRQIRGTSCEPGAGLQGDAGDRRVGRGDERDGAARRMRGQCQCASAPSVVRLATPFATCGTGTAHGSPAHDAHDPPSRLPAPRRRRPRDAPFWDGRRDGRSARAARSRHRRRALAAEARLLEGRAAGVVRRQRARRGVLVRRRLRAVPAGVQAPAAAHHGGGAARRGAAPGRLHGERDAGADALRPAGARRSSSASPTTVTLPVWEPAA